MPVCPEHRNAAKDPTPWPQLRQEERNTTGPYCPFYQESKPFSRTWDQPDEPLLMEHLPEVHTALQTAEAGEEKMYPLPHLQSVWRSRDEAMTAAGKPAARLRKAAVQPKSNQTALEQENGCSKRQSSRKMEVVDYLTV